jgi:ATP phosphoribosyltransferase regulatory subunit HisZ
MVESNVRLHVTDAYKDRPKLLAYFGKIFSATETALNEGIASWLNGINISYSH